MGQSLIITLREGLEAGLIIAIILAYLHRVGYRKGFPAVWWGVAGAIVLSLAGGVLVFSLGLALEGRAEQAFEGAAMLLAVIVLGWMVVWMKRQARNIKRHLEALVQNAMLKGSSAALAGIALLAVGREGLETVLFMFAAYQTATLAQTLIGGLAGLAIAVALAVAIYKGSRFLNLRAFFNVTGVLIIFVAAGLLARGLHELQEAALLPALVEHVWDINPVLNEKAGIGSFLKGILGYNGNPSLIEVVAYGWFLIVTLLYFFWQPRPAAQAEGVVTSRQGASK